MRREVVIEPSRGWGRVDWGELWEYRDLLAVLVRRDFISRYRQTILGPAWFVVQPLLTAAVFAVVFGRVAKIGTDGVPTPLFYLAALLGWNYFSQNLAAGGGTFVNNAHLFGKVYFPRLVIPLAAVVSNLVALALQGIPLLLFLGYYAAVGRLGESVRLTPALALFPLAVAWTGAISFGVSLWMAAGTARYRDLVHLNQYLVQVWMFVTPVFYPLSVVGPEWRAWLWLNPMAANIELYRWTLLGAGTFDGSLVASSFLWTLLILAGGLVAFRSSERKVVDVL